MKKLLSFAIIMTGLFRFTLSSMAEPLTETPLPPVISCANAPGAVLPVETQLLSLKALSGKTVLPLRGTKEDVAISFGMRGDKLVTHAVFRLRYAYSPALIPEQSHIKLTLNEQVIGVMPITKDTLGKEVKAEINIDPRLFTDFNHLNFHFIGHYSYECEDPHHSSLWADINGDSELELTTTPLSIKSELSLLPQPFFDHRDLRLLTLPFVFASSPSLPAINAAGILSSWFGQLASWRGAHFPTHLDKIPPGHAVVLATNNERPAFLGNQPKVEGPSVEIITNPVDGYSKVLVVQGRDGNDLIVAAQALVLGNAALSGTQSTIKEVKNETPRQAYDAPNWVRLDRPTKFGELVTSEQELQGFNHIPETIRINLRIPPDLFTWQSRGVPVNLKYRYTPPVRTSESLLNMSINNELVQSFLLHSSGQGGETARLRVPLLDELLFGENKEILIPAFKLGAQNQLQFNFSFAFYKQGFCQDTQVENMQAMIDADSTLDFSGFPHYAEMPNLSYFVSSGFPFTKFADLSQTVVVIPETPTTYDIQAMLTLLGRMGAATGYPATRFRISGPTDQERLKDADLLVIGALPSQGLLENWSSHLPAIISGSIRQIDQPSRGVNFLFDWLGFDTRPNPAVLSQEKFDNKGPLAALMGFESPLSSGRSVVALTATSPEKLLQGLAALDDSGLARNMHGSVVFIHPQKVEGVLVGKTYFTGHLPFWTRVWYWLSTHPFLLAMMAIVAVLTFAFALWRTLKVVSAKRIQESA
ncbi:MAG: cellulose biosynthesis cyclic di-GMP-binding regulatory protein BcsB [Desulfobulbaceae bacterium]|nr:cellulose biosynthesis cyclic di-GMP-binding regulatory protein BcsB [Desulfobulbaceae bacterium]